MMDYDKTKGDAQHRKAELLQRQQQIPLEKKKLDEELEQNKRELIGLEQVLDGLEFMNSDVSADFEPTGFTDNIRQILSETSVPLVPTQIRDALQARGITGSSSKNLLINVHKVLERIKTELDESTTAEGKTAYKRTESWTENILLKRLYAGRAIPTMKDFGESGGKAIPPLDPEKLPEEVRGLVHPADRIKRRTPEDAMREAIGRNKK